MAERIVVEVAYAEPSRFFLRQVDLPAGACVADAIRACGIEAELQLDMRQLTIGIWSKPTDTDARLIHGDRVELYRPLTIDPMDARRKRARSNRK